MDILADKVLHVLGLLFFPFWLLGFFALVRCGINESRGLDEKARAKKFALGVAAISVPYLLLLLLAAFLLNVSAKDRFEGMLKWKPDQLIISSAAGRTEIRDPSAINDLLLIITQSTKVWAHHSHPIEEATLVFPQTGYTYSLGRDSQNAHEFWLDWTGRDGKKAGASIRHFRSEELERWLQERVPQRS